MLKRLILWTIVIAMTLVGAYAQAPVPMNSGGVLLLNAALLASDDDDDDGDDGDDKDDDDNDDDDDGNNERFRTRRRHRDDDDHRKHRRRIRQADHDDDHDDDDGGRRHRRRARRGNIRNTTQTPQPSQGNCPCNFDVAFWTRQTQILKTPDATTSCTMIDSSGLSTLLSVQVTNGSTQGDSLFFITTDPSSINGGTCAADASFSSGATITTPGGELPVTSEEFPACVSDIAALKSAYVALCSQ